MIVEGIVTSVDHSGRINVAPMGPIVEGNFERLLLRPFQPSTTFSNLSATRCGVFHVVDHVHLIAAAAIGRLESVPECFNAHVIPGWVLADCCRWFEFQVDDVDDSEPRSRMPSTIVHRGERRPFLGFNRARHAVLEAAILATRVHLLPPEDIRTQMTWLQSAVEKTGDQPELLAFRMLQSHIEQQTEATGS